MMENTYWITIAYSLPLTPSRSRVYVWRKLKEIGAENFKQGLAILPSTAENLRVLQALSAKIRTMSGESSLAQLRFLEVESHEKMVAKFREQSENEFRQFYIEAAKLYEQLGANKSEYIQKMHKRYDKIRKRDYFCAEDGLKTEKDSCFSKFIDCLDLDENLSLLWRDMKKSREEVKQKFMCQIKEINNKK